jgi:hypothetical protein
MATEFFRRSRSGLAEHPYYRHRFFPHVLVNIKKSARRFLLVPEDFG